MHREFSNMREILKAFIKSGSGSVANVVLNVAALKILARILGPAGIGLFSLLRQILQTALIAGTLSGQTALVQGASSQKDRARQEYLQTVLMLFIVGGIVMGGGLIAFSPWLARHVTGQNDPVTVSLVRWLSLPVFLNTLLVYSNSVLNAQRAIGRLAIVQGGTALGLALSALPVALAVKHGHELAFIGMLVSSMALGCGLGFTFLWRGGWLAQILSGLARGFSAEAARHFFTVAGTIAITATVQTVSLLVLRAVVVNQKGLRGAGIFDAAWTLSMGYVTLVLISFQT
jgi:O-antigen/teichoic acid export membrane protein